MRTARRLALIALALAATAACAGAPAGAAQPKLKIDPRLRVDTVCLPVTDPAGLPRTLNGKRYTIPGTTSATPAIVLVHGIASSTANWDFSPTWSTARALASAGYVVYSYDRPGYARSSYFDVPGGGETLTTREHRRMLHEVVQDVKTGGDAGRDAHPDGGHSRSQRRWLDRRRLSRHVPRRRRDDPDEHLRHHGRRR